MSERVNTVIAGGGPARHDRFPTQKFAGIDGEDLATGDDVLPKSFALYLLVSDEAGRGQIQVISPHHPATRS